jgi:hypothetical protein
MNWVTDTVIFVLVLILLFVTWPILFDGKDDDDDL